MEKSTSVERRKQKESERIQQERLHSKHQCFTWLLFMWVNWAQGLPVISADGSSRWMAAYVKAWRVEERKNAESQEITASGFVALPLLLGAPRAADLQRCRPGTLPPFHSGTLCIPSHEDIGWFPGSSRWRFWCIWMRRCLATSPALCCKQQGGRRSAGTDLKQNT